LKKVGPADTIARHRKSGSVLNILHAYRTYFPDTQGGLEEVIRQICLNTRRLGANSRVFALSRDLTQSIVDREEARVYRSKHSLEVASCSMSWSALGDFKRLVEWADVVHYHYPWPFVDVLHFAAQVDKPTVLTYHSDIVRQKLLGRLYAPLMTRFLGSVDRIICTSENYFATSQVLPKFSEKVEIIPIGINEDSHPEPSNDDVTKAETTYGRDFFLFVGVLRYYKGLHILLDAIRSAPYRVIIVGSGPTEQELKKQAIRLGLTNVVFTGYLPDDAKISLFKLCRGVVFPSYMRSEAFGVTLLEGAMYSKPLISTEVGSGTSHVNVHGETGLVVPPGSSRALREAMDQLFHRPDMAKLMGRRARDRYERLFTGELMGKRYFALYQRLLETQQANLSKAVTG
jgi:rhamnosyl/mannosyltransferase